MNQMPFQANLFDNYFAILKTFNGLVSFWPTNWINLKLLEKKCKKSFKKIKGFAFSKMLQDAWANDLSTIKISSPKTDQCIKQVCSIKHVLTARSRGTVGVTNFPHFELGHKSLGQLGGIWVVNIFRGLPYVGEGSAVRRRDLENFS